MRKILLLSVALVLVCSLIAAGAIGNSKPTLTAAGAKLAPTTVNKMHAAQKAAKKTADVSLVSNPSKLPTVNLGKKSVGIYPTPQTTQTSVSQIPTRPDPNFVPAQNGKDAYKMVPYGGSKDPIYTPPTIATNYLTQGFEGGALPASWTDVPGTYPWLYAGSNTYGASAPHGGSYFAYFDIWDYSSGVIDTLYSPAINLSGGSHVYTVSFWFYQAAGSSDFVDVILNESGVVTDLGTISKAAAWTQHVYTFSSTSTAAKIGFMGHSFYGNYNPCLDDISIDDAPSTGRCCYGDPVNPSCADNSLSACNGLGGTWTAGVTCAGSPCVGVLLGDNCTAPINVSIPGALPYDVTGATTCGFTNDYAPTCLGSYGSGPDVMYKLNVSTETAVNIECDPTSPTGGSPYGSVSLYAECPPVTCLASAFSASGNQLLISGYDLVPGTYWVMVDNWAPGPDCINYDLHISVGQVVPPPPNDDCANAQAITGPYPQTIVGTTVGATVDCPASLNWNGVWYSIDLPYASNNVSIDYSPTCDMGGNIYTVGVVWMPDCSCSAYTIVNYSWGYCPDGVSEYSLQSFTVAGPTTIYYPAYVVDSNMQGMPFSFNIDVVETPAAPPNDNCADATPAGTLVDGVPVQVTGTTYGATVDCTGLGYPEVWVTFTTTECMNVAIDECGTAPVFDNSFIVIENQCPCGTNTYANNWNNTSCDGNFTVNFTGLPAGTWWYPVLEDAGANGPYVLNITGVACPPPPPPDFVVTAPGSFTDGNTCGAGDDCTLRAGEDQMWQITIPETGDWTFSLCNTVPAWDTYIFLGTSSCTADIGSNDDGTGCTGFLSALTVPGLAAGTYFLDIEPFSSTGCGAYQLDVTEAAPCIVTCPPNATPEGEPTCYDEYVDTFNGGCNSDPVVYSEVSPGETICGTGGDYLVGGAPYRDTDWYHFNVPQDTTVNLIAVAQFPLQAMILNYDCSNIVVLGSALPAACDTARISVNLAAGDYTAWFGEATGTGTPCGSPYWFTLEFATPPPPPPTPCEGPNAVYGQPDDAGNALASQCDAAYPFTAALADDFILPGTGNVNIGEVVTYCEFWNGPAGTTPDALLGVGITIYADNGGVPDGMPIDGDPGCAHTGNGIIYTQNFAPGEFTWSLRTGGDYQIEFPLATNVSLTAGTTYWLEFYPQLGFSTAGQIGWYGSTTVTGSVAVQGFPMLGIPYWTPNTSGLDASFCLLGPTAPPGCVYLPGDINGNGSVNGVDIVFAVNYFKGQPHIPPVDCYPVCPGTPNPFYAAGDVNGNCAFNGIDITYFVRFLKGQVPSLLHCPSCPPAPVPAMTPNFGGKVAPKGNSQQ